MVQVVGNRDELTAPERKLLAMTFKPTRRCMPGSVPLSFTGSVRVAHEDALALAMRNLE